MQNSDVVVVVVVVVNVKNLHYYRKGEILVIQAA